MQQNDKKLAAQMRGVRAANSVLNGISKISHYQSYHAYRRSLKWAIRYVILAFVIGCIGVIPNVARTYGQLTTLSLIMMITYFFWYYWIMAKSKQMRQDARDAMLMTAMNGIVSDAWRIYDGIYDRPGFPDRNVPGQESLEIVFAQDHSYLRNIYWILKHRPASLPPKPEDIINLKRYLVGLQNLSNEVTQYVAYGSMTDQIARYLATQGIELTPLPKKYVTKPSRWDYAAATGKLKNALWGYPHHFAAYQMVVNEDQVEQDTVDNFKANVKVKKRQRKIAKLQNDN
ncbi:hypothetical protein FOD75_10915 (plasmid) [Limosilactobacillus reuteri]|uniref:Uncharacterized protein n=1 Tax=Limosilactobacillus reuteri TaxID=1598 RepID=A0A517D8C1_LIMRT|nr:hypothetical protein [Limosilactobacillus reuteri]QDR73600.1 hypothetical protein FOD75_10915 [Limosilactobacillus reuteri]